MSERFMKEVQEAAEAAEAELKDAFAIDLYAPEEEDSDSQEQEEEKVSPPPPPDKEQEAQPAPMSAPLADYEAKYRELSEKYDTTNAQLQMLMSKLESPRQSTQEPPQEEQDPYFVSREEVERKLSPALSKMQEIEKEIFLAREERVIREFSLAEERFKQKYSDFDDFVKPEVRAKALANVREAVKKGNQAKIDWETLFEMEHSTNSAPVYRKQIEEMRKKETLAQEQKQELSKVASLPKGGNIHQAEKAPKRARGESANDAFRRKVAGVLKALG